MTPEVEHGALLLPLLNNEKAQWEERSRGNLSSSKRTSLPSFIFLHKASLMLTHAGVMEGGCKAFRFEIPMHKAFWFLEPTTSPHSPAHQAAVRFSSSWVIVMPQDLHVLFIFSKKGLLECKSSKNWRQSKDRGGVPLPPVTTKSVSFWAVSTSILHDLV